MTHYCIVWFLPTLSECEIPDCKSKCVLFWPYSYFKLCYFTVCYDAGDIFAFRLECLCSVVFISFHVLFSPPSPTSELRDRQLCGVVVKLQYNYTK